MSYARPQRHRADSNKDALVAIFRQLHGVWIPYASKPFDGWAWHRAFGGACYLPVEIKDPEREGLKYEYTPRQKKLMAELKIIGATWLTWRTEIDVFDCVKARRAA